MRQSFPLIATILGTISGVLLHSGICKADNTASATVVFGYFTTYCAQCHAPDQSESFGISAASDLQTSNFATGMLSMVARGRMPRMDGWNQAKIDQWNNTDRAAFVSNLSTLLGVPQPALVTVTTTPSGTATTNPAGNSAEKSTETSRVPASLESKSFRD